MSKAAYERRQAEERAATQAEAEAAAEEEANAPSKREARAKRRPAMTECALDQERWMDEYPVLTEEELTSVRPTKKWLKTNNLFQIPFLDKKQFATYPGLDPACFEEGRRPRDCPFNTMVALRLKSLTGSTSASRTANSGWGGVPCTVTSAYIEHKIGLGIDNHIIHTVEEFIAKLENELQDGFATPVGETAKHIFLAYKHNGKLKFFDPQGAQLKWSRGYDDNKPMSPEEYVETLAFKEVETFNVYVFRGIETGYFPGSTKASFLVSERSLDYKPHGTYKTGEKRGHHKPWKYSNTLEEGGGKKRRSRKNRGKKNNTRKRR
jgi:hypothetical protein